jgi:hypothetical protein
VKCKPGILAFVISTDPENLAALGRVVTVIKERPDIGFDEWEIVFEGADPFPDFLTKTSADLALADHRNAGRRRTPIETNVPEALRLALGIESRSYA